jgi:adenylate kinase
VIELKVDPDILVRRIEDRVQQMKLRGEPLRPDDKPEVLKQRLTAYQAQTAPLVDYYRQKGALRTVDGMASISDVGAAIGRALADAAFRPVSGRRTAGSKAQAKAQGQAREKAQTKAQAKAAGRKKAPSKPKQAKAEPRRKPRPAAGKPASRKLAPGRQKSSKTARPRRLTK